MIRRIFWLACVFFLLTTSQAVSDEAPLRPTSLPIADAGSDPILLSVQLHENISSISVHVDGPHEVRNVLTGELLSGGEGALQATILAGTDGLEVNEARYRVDALVIDGRGAPIQTGERAYQDRVRILRRAPNSLVVINDVEVETYLKGVLPLEVSAAWPLEALKAHAVVSRTFALFKAIEKRGQDSVLRDNVLSQVYGGSLFHQGASSEAVDLTKGEILTFNNQIFPAFFHANCGGHTTSVDAVFRLEPHPALKAIQCPFCRGTKHYEWSFELSTNELEEVMHERGYPAKGIRSVTFLNRDESGRADSVTIEYKRSTLTVPATDLRQYLGYDRLRSLKSDAAVRDGVVQFNGFGWGHGVGFCQWGAKGQAEKGKSYREILEFYFPGSEIQIN
jgi:stage II sporulation protein D